MTYEVLIDGRSYRLELVRVEHGWKCRLDGEDVKVDGVIVRPNVLSLIVHGDAYEIVRQVGPADLQLWIKNERLAVEILDPRLLRSRRSAGGSEEGPQKIVAPMAGRVVRIMAAVGAEVEAGQGLVVIEAMKMQNELKALKRGTVKQVMISAGSAVNAGDVLAVVE